MSVNGMKRNLAALSIACAIAFGSQADPTYRYAIIDLGALNGTITTARGLNDLGQVVGSSQLDPLGIRPFLWDRGVMIDLGSLGGLTGQAEDINESGQVVGRSAIEGVVDENAFLWDRGTMYDLDSHGPYGSSGRAINDLGQVVGTTSMSIPESVEIDPYSSAFLWEDWYMRPLVSFARHKSSKAVDINNTGQILGSAKREDDSWEYNILWEPDGSIHVIEHDAHAFFSGTLNNLGHVGGRVIWNDGDESHAAVWDGENIIDYHPQGAEWSDYGIINDFGHMLGRVDHAPAFWWSPGNYVLLRHELPPNHGWNVYEFELRDLNNHDQIVGYGEHRKDELRGFIVTPVYPELELSDPVPGVAGEMNTWTVSGAQPGAEITFVYGLRGGGDLVGDCDMLDAVIQLDDATFMGTATADATGTATLSLYVPSAAANLPGVMFQAFDSTNCNESQLSVFTFE